MFYLLYPLIDLGGVTGPSELQVSVRIMYPDLELTQRSNKNVLSMYQERGDTR
jgi:hypothetical protein